MEYAIAVIDIGMTNKKIAVYDNTLSQLEALYKNFEAKIVNSPQIRALQAHDLEAMEEWFVSQLQELGRKYPIRALAVSAHGATFVCVGKDGKNALPCLYYTHEPGEDFHRRFYERFGEEEFLQTATGTPAFKALINPAKGIFFAQEQFPQEFKNVTSVLPYPQYWGFRFSGKIGIEPTYMGNHTYLWDYGANTFSTVAHKLGIARLMPDKPCKSWDTLGKISSGFAAKTGLSKETVVTMGIHDSNSALLPYFAKKGNSGFILNSTGTWCVTMNPVEKYGFEHDELGKAVLFNISAFGAPIKTAIFFGGLEFETWSKLFFKIHGREDFPQWNEKLYREILKERRLFLLPELKPGSGQFPLSKARIAEDGKNYYFDAGNFSPPSLNDYEKCFAALRISLVMQTQTALERSGIKKDYDVYVEGGFRKDEAYSRLLSSAIPNNKVFLTDIAEASALGAAMTGKIALSKIALSKIALSKIALSGKDLASLADDFEINIREQEKVLLQELEAYRQDWLTLAEKQSG